MENKRTMIQCVCCKTVFTKDGYPNKFFNYNDLHIYGCSQCKLGDWKTNSKNTLVGYRVSIVRDLEGNEKEDTGYIDYQRDKNKQIEGLNWEDLAPYPRPGAKDAFTSLESIENIEQKVA